MAQMTFPLDRAAEESPAATGWNEGRVMAKLAASFLRSTEFL